MAVIARAVLAGALLCLPLVPVGAADETAAAGKFLDKEKRIELRGETGPTLKSGPRWWYLTMILARAGETDKARSYYDELVRIMEKQPTVHASYIRLRAEAAELLGIYDEPDQKEEAAEPPKPQEKKPEVGNQ